MSDYYAAARLIAGARGRHLSAFMLRYEGRQGGVRIGGGY